MQYILLILLLSFITFVIYRITYFFSNKGVLEKVIYSFVCFLGTFELINVPLNIMHINIKIRLIIHAILITLFIIYSIIIFGFKKIQLNIKFNWKWLPVILILVMQIIGIGYFYNENADDAFYVSLVTQNVESNHTFQGNPSLGISDKSNNILINYMTNSHEIFQSYISFLTDISAPTLCHTIIPMIGIVFVYLAIYFLLTQLFEEKKIDLWKIILIVSTIMLCSYFSDRSLTCFTFTRLWQGKAMYYAFMLPITLGIMLKKENNPIILLLLVLANVFFSPIGLFLSSFVYLIFFIISLFSKDKKRIIGFLISGFSFLLIFVEIYIIRKTNNVNSNLLTISSSVNNNLGIDFKSLINIYFSNTKLLILYLISLLYVLFKGNRKSKVLFILYPLLVILLFYNPITGKYISYYIMHADIYWRTAWLLPIEYTMMYFWIDLIDNNKKYQIYLILIMVLIYTSIGGFVYTTDKSNLPFNNIQKIDGCVVNEVNYLLENGENLDTALVLAPSEPFHGSTVRQLTSKINLFWSRDMYIGKRIYPNIDAAIKVHDIYNNSYIDTDEYIKLLHSFNIKYIIVPLSNLNSINYMNNLEFKVIYGNSCDNIYEVGETS